jgi:hypothetical protein
MKAVLDATHSEKAIRFYEDVAAHLQETIRDASRGQPVVDLTGGGSGSTSGV